MGERVERVPGLQHGGDTGGAQFAVDLGDGGEAFGGSGVGRCLRYGLQVCCELSGFQLCHALEFDTGDIVQFQWEAVVLHFHDGIGNVVDGVVGRGHRGVSAGIGRGQRIVRVRLFAGGQFHDVGLAVLEHGTAAIRVEGVFSVEQIAMCAQQPIWSVG